MPHEQTFFDAGLLAKKALDLIEPSILLCMKNRIFKRSALHVVLADPLAAHRRELKVLARRDYGTLPQSRWKYPYDQIARGKLEITVRTGQTTRLIHALSPQLLLQGDIKYKGSVLIDGTPAAASGVEDYFDEMAAGWAAMTYNALVRGQFQKVPDSEVLYLGEDEPEKKKGARK